MRRISLPICALIGLLPTCMAHAQAITPNTITITGTAVIKVTPDVASITVNLTSADKSAAAALQANRDTVAHVMELLRPFNIPAANVQVSNPNLSNGRAAAVLLAGQPQQATGNYQVNDRLNIRVEDYSKVAAIVEAVAQGGGVVSINTQVDVKERAALEDKARAEAAENARHQADALAAAQGIKVDKIIALSTAPGPASLFNNLNLGLMGNGALQDGQISISEQVVVVFGLQ